MFHKSWKRSFLNFQEDIVKVGPAIDQHTGKASLKAKRMIEENDEESLLEDEVNNSLPLSKLF